MPTPTSALNPEGRLARVARWGACYAVALPVGWLIWIVGIDETPYRWELRLGVSMALVFLAGVIAKRGGVYRWRLPVLVGGLAGVMTPPAVVLVLLFLAGPNWAS
jgi:hypothetical protein